MGLVNGVNGVTYNNNNNYSRNRYMETFIPREPRDSYTKQTRRKKKSKVKNILTTIAVAGVSAFAVYKGKDHIHDYATKFTDKFSNLTKGCHYIGEAIKTPFKALKKAFT